LDRRRNALLGVIRDCSVHKRNSLLVLLNESKLKNAIKILEYRLPNVASHYHLDLMQNRMVKREKYFRNATINVLYDESGREKNVL